MTYEWVTMDKCTPRLDACKFARLGSDPDSNVAAAAASEDDVANTLVLYQGSQSGIQELVSHQIIDIHQGAYSRHF